MSTGGETWYGQTAEDRFWKKVEKNHGCWEWTAFINPKGYGAFFGGKKEGYGAAHRFSWVIANGPIPEGMHVLHTCDNTGCVNPEHLFLGTNADNVADRCAKGRSGTTMGRSGAKNSMSKLTDRDVFIIRYWYQFPRMTQARIAKYFGVSHQCISKIVRGDRWSTA